MIWFLDYFFHDTFHFVIKWAGTVIMASSIVYGMGLFEAMDEGNWRICKFMHWVLGVLFSIISTAFVVLSNATSSIIEVIF